MLKNLVEVELLQGLIYIFITHLHINVFDRIDTLFILVGKLPDPSSIYILKQKA